MTKNVCESLINKIETRSAVIGVVGLGYVGLPLAIRFSQEGFKVIGFDIDRMKIESLCSGVSYIEHIPSADVGRMLASRAEFVNDFSMVSLCDAILICVPTPLSKHREPDLSYVVGTLEQITLELRSGQIISLESTTYPGTTKEEIIPRCQSANLVVGEDIFVVYSPEREDPGNTNYSTQNIPKVVGGASARCLKAGVALYSAVIETVVTVSSPEAAEMTKLLENIHRAVNIGLVNEMKIVADKMGVDIFEVVDAAKTKPFGFTAYYPGPGLGGHCIPIDPFYLTWKAREYGLHTRFIELAGEINKAMPEYVVAKLMDGLNERGQALRGARVLVLGVAYKPNVDDMRESPSVEIMELIKKKGAQVEYSDPHVPVFPKMRDHSFNLKSVELCPATIGGYDAVLLATDHDRFNYEEIKEYSKLLIDCRGRYRGSFETIIKA